ncbi:phosphate ABC transporter substrate-binding protein PstS [Falsiroseomonas stagni]|uniref:Phosphate-binding protein PstS n=1 Tax=Falsiroseomonas stagni DSM 19981 TaxID=1123062 RepID=A0A1I3Z158_9PROT|nr:phosphate ABC transporter substrate-binding protein PstS [Falsiroseomonas stagni]SFK37823.1 phosphate transport system substrate-binding protein [Falsiroseomonas stagni DSM 19981]
MNRRTLLLGTGAALGAGLFDARGAMAQTVTITGAGATFPRPVYERWANAARTAAGIQLNYQSIGSGGGINQITNRTVDFGATDAPRTLEQLREGNLMQFPTVMGSIVLIVNLPGVADRQLKLTPEVITDIFFGRLTRWNDNRIAELNRGLRIPSLPISVAYRADASGTTWGFTNYLARVSQAWKDGPGAGTSIQWPAGQGARGNEGVANAVRNTPGAIGYAENAYAVVNRLVTTQIRNKAGNFVEPVQATFVAAADAADWTVPNMAPDTLDLPGANAWPMTVGTYILLPTNPAADKVEGSRNTMRFFDWAFKNGAQIAGQLEYIPLPDSVTNVIRRNWAAMVKAPNGAPVWTA